MKLHKKLIIWITVILVSLLSVYSYYIIDTMKRQVLNQMKSSATILAESLEQGIVTTGAMHNGDVLEKLIIQYNRVEGIDDAYVVDTGYKIIAHPNSARVGKVYDNEDVRDAIRTGRVTTEFKKEDGKDLYDIVTPIVEEGRVVGAIEVELGLTQVNQMISSAIFKSIVSLCITAFILALTLIVIIFNVIIKRLEKLVNATDQIAAGSFKTLNNVGSPDEIGQLTCAFNNMVLALEKLSQRDKSSNPLTGLPGNIVIKEELDRRLKNNEQFSILYIDLDNFKTFNDVCGFEFGDEMIKYTAEKITQTVKEQGNPGDFVGHIGGDDFVAITEFALGEPMAKRITELFEFDSRENFDYKINHVRPSISVAHLKVLKGTVDNSLKLGEMAAELKKKVKMLSGSNYLTELT